MKSRGIGSWVGLLLVMVLSACASPPVAAPIDHLLHDALFAPRTVNTDADQVFAISPAMREHLRTPQFSQTLKKQGRAQGLLEALYTRTQLQLEYDADITRTAAQTFEERRGNCLSLVVMTAAFANELGIPVIFQSVYIDELWSRSGNMALLSEHVNLRLAPRLGETMSLTGDMMTVDFLPPEQRRGERARAVNEATIVAMFMNNRAVESLRQGQTTDAYWWARAAVRADPLLLLAFNTLAIVYRQSGHSAQAELALNHVLQHEPDNAQSLSNLVLILGDLGRLTERQAVAQRLARVQPVPPYHYFDLGQNAMKERQFSVAKTYFEKEIARQAYNAEFHFWLAQAHYQLQNRPAARAALALAVEHSTTVRDREKYAALLETLRAPRPTGAARSISPDKVEEELDWLSR